jgi:class 3 adenylate cyclase
LAESLAQEELHQLMQRFFADVDGVLLNYGGVIDKHIGDAVMALFGAPIAHDNDHERAVRAAIDLHSCLDTLSKDMEYELKVHIGIASGLVVASDIDNGNHHEYTVLGDSVNLASRLVDLAGPGETLISDEVCHSVADIFSIEDIGQQAIKGVAKPVRVWKVTRVTAENNHRRRLPLIGRQRELKQFEGILETFDKTGTGQVIHLCGEAGIGKSRLVEEFSTKAMKNSFVCHSTLLLNFGVGKQRDGIRCLVNSLLQLGPEASQQECHTIVQETISRGLLDSGQSVFLNGLLDLAGFEGNNTSD